MKRKKIALITGITGQDGSYLCEFLLKKNYIVHGLKRRTSSFNTGRIDHIYEELDKKNKHLFLHYCDMTDGLSLNNLINKILPDEIYNLAAMSHVKVSFELPEYVANVDGLGVLRILESIKNIKQKKIKFYQASTSELYGKVKEIPQNENTSFRPRSPYAISKLYAHWLTINYREAYKIFACNGILFNHESERRGETFVTRKISMGVAKVVTGMKSKITLGNLNAKRDWGHAKDYVEAMWLILQQKNPEDWVIATGKNHTIKKFLILAFKHLGVDLSFKGEGINEKGYVKNFINQKHKLKIGQLIVDVSDRYYRPTEVDELVGDYSKAKKKLNWSPKIGLEDIVKEMVDNDLKKIINTN
ncbi:GDP-mannose 4,6-dehydratase [bacterium]|nr:GDP-mannose 4,6-dehydratase [bacterium]